MKTLKSISVFALAVSLLSSCGSTAHIEKDAAADLTKYKSYTWITKDVKESAKSNISDIAAENIKNSVNEELQKNGYTEVKSQGQADLLLTYDVLIEKNTKVERDPVYSNSYTRTFYNPYTRRFMTYYYPSRFLGYDENAVDVKEGTVTITMIDPKTDKTVWQGWATDELNSSKLTSKDIERNVKSIFRKFEAQ